MFERIPEQDEAKRLVAAALADGPAHAYLFHGPAGVGKRSMALAFAEVLLRDGCVRVGRRAHPDLYVLEPLGDQIRIDPIRELRRDLHMRPFEADRRVYLIFCAHLMNEDAADALLKDLEEPPAYATLILVADELGPLPETIRSRCQLVPFRRLSERAVRREVERRAPALGADEARAVARLAAGRLDRVERLLDAAAAARRAVLLHAARAAYRDDEFDAAAAAAVILRGARERGAETKADVEARLERFDLPPREADQALRRAQRGGEREHLLRALEELAAWYRDLLVVGVGAESAVIHADRLAELREDAVPDRLPGAELAAEHARDVWRLMEELNLQAPLALEALFLRLRAAFDGAPVAAGTR